jgi:phage-related protein (TIGR01555 family)
MTTLTKNLFRFDGWKNLLSGLGGRRDKTRYTKPSPVTRLSDIELAALYYGDPIAADAVDYLPEDMTKAGFEVNEDNGELEQAFNELHGPEKFKEALAYTELYGGAIILMDIEGSGTYDQPYDPAKGKKVRALRVYPRTRIDLGLMKQVVLPESPYFEDYEQFVIRKIDGATFKAHASRCLIFRSPIKVDPTMAGFVEHERYWGLPAVLRYYDAVAAYGTLIQGLTHLSQELAVGKYKLANLEQLVAEGDYRSINRRMDAIDTQKSLVNGVFLGEGEDYTREQLTLSGVDALTDRFMMHVAAATRYSVTRLFGRSAAGLNATGKGDQDNYYDRVKSAQTNRMTPPLIRLLEVLNNALKVLPKGEKIAVTYNPLYPLDSTQEADVRSKIAQADAIYIDRGVLSQDEVRSNRFLGGYKLDTSVDTDAAPNLVPPNTTPAV